MDVSKIKDLIRQQIITHDYNGKYMKIKLN